MAWTTPRTWVNGEVPGETIMNAHVRDNLIYLLARPAGGAYSSTAYSTTSTSYVNVDATNLAVTITVQSTQVLVFASTPLGADNTAGNDASMVVTGNNSAGDSNTANVAQNNHHTRTIIHRFAGLTPGTTYTFTLRYKASTGTAYVNFFLGVGAFLAAMEI